MLLFPTLIWTSAPGMEPNVTWTDDSFTFLPMSRIRPVPVLVPPNTGLPR